MFFLFLRRHLLVDLAVLNGIPALPHPPWILLIDEGEELQIKLRLGIEREDAILILRKWHDDPVRMGRLAAKFIKVEDACHRDPVRIPSA